MKSAIILFWSMALPLFCQAPDIRNYFNLFAEGKTQEVKVHLPDLLINYPDDPGVQFLLGMIAEDPDKAAVIFRKVISSSPASEWADEAYYQLVMYSVLKGDTASANSYLREMTKNTPGSSLNFMAYNLIRYSGKIGATGNIAYSKPPEPPIETMDRIPQENIVIYHDKKTPENEKILDGNVIDRKVVHDTESRPDTADFATLEVISDTAKEEPVQAPGIPSAPAADTASPEPEVLAVNEIPLTPQMENKIPETVNTVPAQPGEPYFGLQVATYPDQASANVQVKKYLNRRMRAQVVPVNTNGIAEYAVIIGNYSSKKSAEAAKLIVQQECKCSPLIMER